MKFEANRRAMLEAARSVAKIAPNLSSKNNLKKILLECNDDTGEVHMAATNHDVSVQHKIIASVEESGSLLIQPDLLVGIMSKLEGEHVKISTQPDKPRVLIITGGRCTFRINNYSPEGYPKPTMPFPEESVIMTGICSLVKKTTIAISKDETKLALQCVQIRIKNNAVHAAACDTTSLMLVKDSATNTDECEFLLPGRSLQVLASICADSDVFEVGDIGHAVVFVRGDMTFTIRKWITGSFIDVATVVKDITPLYAAVVDVGEMKEALNLISITALAGSGRKPVNLVLSDGEIIMRCKNDHSEGKSCAPASVSKKTPDEGFLYDVFALIKLFQVVSGRVKLEIDDRGFMSVKTRNEAYFQSSVRPQAENGEPAEETEKQKRAKGTNDVKVRNETTKAKEAA